MRAHSSSMTRDILEHLAEGGKIMLGAFFPRGYSYTDPSRRVLGLDRRCRHHFTPKQQRSISSILSRLRKEGLVARDGTRKQSVWHITRRGHGHVQSLAEMAEVLPHHKQILPKKDGKVRIVIFDIPESERRKRAWLRAQLVACDFGQLQKSVWTGTRPIPETLIADIESLGLGSYIHVMGIGEKGTLVLKKLA